jgi:hypothetical protein
MKANEASTEIDDDLLKTYCISSIEELGFGGEFCGLGNSYSGPVASGFLPEFQTARGLLYTTRENPRRSSCFRYMFGVF